MLLLFLLLLLVVLGLIQGAVWSGNVWLDGEKGVLKAGILLQSAADRPLVHLVSRHRRQEFTVVRLLMVSAGDVSSSFLSPLNHIRRLLMVSAGDVSSSFLSPLNHIRRLLMVSAGDVSSSFLSPLNHIRSSLMDELHGCDARVTSTMPRIQELKTSPAYCIFLPILHECNKVLTMLNPFTNLNTIFIQLNLHMHMQHVATGSLKSLWLDGWSMGLLDQSEPIVRWWVHGATGSFRVHGLMVGACCYRITQEFMTRRLEHGATRSLRIYDLIMGAWNYWINQSPWSNGWSIGLLDHSDLLMVSVGDLSSFLSPLNHTKVSSLESLRLLMVSAGEE
ncbi:hypothetical protein LAZ67_18000194 [Cordylochernes scorpioides]|uniref:Uncharacterized protein n=1 Tax=Cordylochernes scorpioides TaxID=51811 RepID=A0ABY6LIW7_9ARAC|nr:hypothetical protein LAZ67_18000194 [Cordylochernes scorpioides]